MGDGAVKTGVRTRNARRWILAGIVAVALVAIALMTLRGNYSRIAIESCFSDVQGLQEGSDVRFAGVGIGKVMKIRARPDDKECPAHVEMVVSPGYDLKIPNDSLLTIETAGVLGSAFIDIDARAASGAPIANHGVLKSRTVQTATAADMIKIFSKLLDRSSSNKDGKQGPDKGITKP